MLSCILRNNGYILHCCSNIISGDGLGTRAAKKAHEKNWDVAEIWMQR